MADIVKLNDEELPKIMSLNKAAHKDDIFFGAVARPDLRPEAGLRLRAAHAAVCWCAAMSQAEHPGFRVRVADTVGSGDAFTAGLVHEYLHGASLDLMNEVANLVGAWVASEVGAMPAPKRGALEHSLAEIR